jgi:hypothetical protein
MNLNKEEFMILEAKGEFKKILDYILGEAQSQQIHEVERSLFARLLVLGLLLLKLFLERKGDGNVGETHTDASAITRPLHKTKKEKTYFSIFGKVVIERAYYWLRGQGGLCPLDAQLNLPEESYSYLLGEWATLLGVREAYNKVTDIFKMILGIDLCNRPLEAMMRDASEQVEDFYEQQPAPAPETEGEILVVTADNKGVPMKRQEPTNPDKKRLKKGEKRGKEKMSTVSAVYTIDKNNRSVDDVVAEVLEADRAVKEKEKPKGPESKPDRPKPKNKVVRATLQGKQAAFDELAKEVQQRKPEGKKQRVALVDGEHKLRELIQTLLTGFCIILDLFHVLEYLWKAAHVFHKEGSDEAAVWVKVRLRMLLEGKVAWLIGSLKDAVQHEKLSPSKRKTLKTVITYLENGQDYMRYDLYLAKGYPIGSGVVEGACRNLVKDRMELTGMHWTIDGAEAVLQMRSADVNGLWKDFWNVRTQKEHERLYKNYGVGFSDSDKITV